jgi:hypothetical protein
MTEDRGKILQAWARNEQKLDPPLERMVSLAKALKPQADAIDAALARLPFEAEPASFAVALERLREAKR